MLDQKVLDAQKIVAEFKENNKKTKRVYVGFNPETKCHVFKTVEVDPNAKAYFNSIRKSDKKQKTQEPTATKKIPKERKKISYESRAKHPTAKYYELLKQGKKPSEIAELLNVRKGCVYANIRKYCEIHKLDYKALNLNTSLGATSIYPPSAYYELRKKGFMIGEIATELGVTKSTVSQNLNKYYSSKPNHNKIKRVCGAGKEVAQLIEQCIAEKRKFDVYEAMKKLGKSRTTIIHHRDYYLQNLDYETKRLLHPTGRKMKKSILKKNLCQTKD